MHQWFLVFLTDLFPGFIGTVFGDTQADQLILFVNKFNDLAFIEINDNIDNAYW